MKAKVIVHATLANRMTLERVCEEGEVSVSYRDTDRRELINLDDFIVERVKGVKRKILITIPIDVDKKLTLEDVRNKADITIFYPDKKDGLLVEVDKIEIEAA